MPVCCVLFLPAQHCLSVCLSRVEACQILWESLPVRCVQGDYIFYAGGSIAGVSCRRRWPLPTTLALSTLVAQCELSRR